jgi:hypothetical protein
MLERDYAIFTDGGPVRVGEAGDADNTSPDLPAKGPARGNGAHIFSCRPVGANPLLAYVLKDALPVCPLFRSALMDPQTIDLDHRRPMLDPLKKHALRLLNSFQLRVRLEAEPLPERFGDDNAPRFVDPEFHASYVAICHLKWQ